VGVQDSRRRRTEALASSAGRQIASLERDLASIIDASASANSDDEHDPEGATIAFERQQVIALLDQARQTAARLERALARLDRGGYGTCEDCGAPIGEERLEARPASTTCIQCARTGGRPQRGR
jgi:RNA polymerase-binding protein DksA